MNRIDRIFDRARRAKRPHIDPSVIAVRPVCPTCNSRAGVHLAAGADNYHCTRCLDHVCTAADLNDMYPAPGSLAPLPARSPLSLAAITILLAPFVLLALVLQPSAFSLQPS
jgi:ribosomal protein S27AE